MKCTPVLFRQSLKRFIKFQWFAHGKIKVVPTPTEDILKSYGHEVVDIKEVLHPRKLEKKRAEVIGYYDPEIPRNEKHPEYEAEPCFIYKDENVLLEGLEQAKVLTKTVEISDGLPQTIVEIENKLDLPNEIHSEVKKKIMLSCMFEATQEKLPKLKDPLKPAWNFPREYGITDVRKNELLCKNLLTVSEQFVKNIKHKSVVMDAFFSVPFEAHNKKIKFEISSELVVTTEKKLEAIVDPNVTDAVSLNKLYPVDCTISLLPFHFYKMNDLYPLNVKSKWPYVQTAFLHFNSTQVKNIFEEEVTKSQFQGRSLLKGFAIAAAEARALFGRDIKELPEPVVVPVVHTDGKIFHFTIFQLNTLDLDKQCGVKNIFWNSSEISLYQTSKYIEGKPILKDYNPDVIKRIVSFNSIE